MEPVNELLIRLGGLNIEQNVPMRSLTSFKLGGPADFVLFPTCDEEILLAINTAKQLNLPYYVMGSGTNLLVKDCGLRGLVIRIAGSFGAIVQQNNTITADAGLSLTALAKDALSRGLQGLEWACGIPGTLGGACAMNAGAYGGETASVLKSVRVLEDDKIISKAVKPGDMGYRKSKFCAPGSIVLGATLKLEPDDGNAALRQAEFMARRQQKQPLSEFSAGSTFKRPEGHFAGALIEGAGLKGCTIGGAKVSELHAGFLINTGDATSEDMLRLIDHVRERVLKTYGVELESEVKIW